MAQSKQALRSRIKSVNSTRKITKAMEMIANAKLFKQRSRMEANREYAQRLQDTVDEIVAHNQDAESKYIRKRSGGNKKATLVFCSDLGLCGGYNSNVMKMARENMKKDEPMILIGTSLFRQMKEAGFNMLNKEPISSDRANFMSIKEQMEKLIDLYTRDEVDHVQLLYTRFVNTMTFRPEFDHLLPAELGEAEDIEKDDMYVETLFEPSASAILDKLIPMMIQNVAYADWMESTTAEQGSRRMAMKTATDNADELSSSLKLEYNKARQAAITQEITEIVGGSSAV